jgi:hypothetical protein
VNTDLGITLGIAIVIGAAICVLVCLSDKRLRKLAGEHMAGRPRLSPSEFGAKYYAAHADFAARVRMILADHLPVDLSQLRLSGFSHCAETDAGV